MQFPTNVFIAAAKELSGIWTQYSIPSIPSGTSSSFKLKQTIQCRANTQKLILK